MAAIVFKPREETPEVVMRDRIPEGAARDRVGIGELDNTVRVFHPGDADHLQMFEIHVEPGCGPHAHAHGEDEIIYVLEGEMHFGSRVLGAGSSVYIPGHTLYSFRAGPEGLRFLNFRGRADSVFITKDELGAMRRAGQSVED